MFERFFSQTEWQGIQFEHLGIPLVPNKPASVEFYDAFYLELKNRYKSYADLPTYWLASKRATAQEVANLLDPSERVLSYGAGIGYVESLLLADCPSMSLNLWDFSQVAAHFDPRLTGHYLSGATFPVVANDVHFDTIYMIQTLYALSVYEATNLLRRLSGLLEPDGRLILIDTSVRPSENGTTSMGQRLRSIGRNFGFRRFTVAARAFVQRGSPERGEQGWGWQRDNDLVALICQDAGLSVTQVACGAQQAIVSARRS